ncbi:MAG: hypothetical protein ACK53L_03850 [Pirellulaceae bacterium]
MKGRCQEVVAALIRAAERGVICRVLVDALGSQQFLRSPTASEMRRRGIHIQAALPGGIWRLPFVRFDLRFQRKIVLIDELIDRNVSINLVDHL